jgi:hypothetical protein
MSLPMVCSRFADRGRRQDRHGPARRTAREPSLEALANVGRHLLNPDVILMQDF